MEQSILQTFFEKNLPLHQPLDDELLKAIEQGSILKRNFRYLFSVEDMIRMSFRLENFVMSIPNHCDMHASFQQWSRFTRQKLRYEDVVKAAKNLWIYGARDIEMPDFPNAKFIDTTATQLTNYWFLILYGDGVSGTLLAVDNSPLGELNSARSYSGFYTFDPMIAMQLTSILHQYYPADVPNPLTGAQHPKAE